MIIIIPIAEELHSPINRYALPVAALRQGAPGVPKMEDRKKQDRNLQDQYFGKCRTGKWRTILQGWKMRDIQVAHPKLFSFLGHLRRATVDNMNDKRRLSNGRPIRRPRKKSRLLNETRLLSCMSKFDDGCYSGLQFLRAAGHCVSHAEVF